MTRVPGAFLSGVPATLIPMTSRRPSSPASRPPQSPRPGARDKARGESARAKGNPSENPARPVRNTGAIPKAPTPSSRPGATSPVTGRSSRPSSRRPARDDAYTENLDHGDPVERFRTKRSVTFDGGRGSRQYSLRLVAIALFAILAVIIVAPTFSHYLEKQKELSQARTQLTDTKARIADLQKELDLWNDDDYVRTQARERLGYVLPGQTLYVVADPNKGSAQERLEQKVAEVDRNRRAVTPWFVTMWDSISVAGSVGSPDNPNNVPILTPDGTSSSAPASSVPAN